MAERFYYMTLMNAAIFHFFFTENIVFSRLWVRRKEPKDVIEASTGVDGCPHRSMFNQASSRPALEFCGWHHASRLQLRTSINDHHHQHLPSSNAEWHRLA